MEVLDEQGEMTFSFSKEDILWEGIPNPPFRITYLAHGGHHDVMTGGTSPFVLLTMATTFFAGFFFKEGSIVGVICAIVIGVFIFIRPDFIRYKRKKNIHYYLLKDGIYFKLSGWKDEKSSFMPYSEIKRINMIPYTNGSGDIIVYPKGKLDFKTYDFESNKPFNFPTLVMIKDVRAVASLIQKCINN